MEEIKQIGKVYKSLSQARVKLQEQGLKKTGKNEYSNFNYFELSDFLPAINKINEELNLFSMFKFPNESTDRKAYLTIMSTEDGSQITFESEVAECIMQTKNGRINPIQEQGGRHTYIRRYLYMEAYEIAESDIVDSFDNQPQNNNARNQKKPEPPKMISQDQLSKIFAMANKENICKADLEPEVEKQYKKKLKELTVQEGTQLIKNLPNIFAEIRNRIKNAAAKINEAVNTYQLDDFLSEVMTNKKINSLDTCTLHTLKEIYSALNEKINSLPKEKSEEENNKNTEIKEDKK